MISQDFFLLYSFSNKSLYSALSLNPPPPKGMRMQVMCPASTSPSFLGHRDWREVSVGGCPQSSTNHLCLWEWLKYYFFATSDVFPSLGRVVLCRRCPVGWVAQSPWSPEWELQVCPLCGWCVPFCCNWALITVSTSVGGIDPQLTGCEDWL